MQKEVALVPPERIERSILLIRGQKVMLDRDLASLYGVATRVLNQAVKRNLDRFPDDFMFHLTSEEAASWARSRSQIEILESIRTCHKFQSAIRDDTAGVGTTAVPARTDRIPCLPAGRRNPQLGGSGMGKRYLKNRLRRFLSLTG